MRTFVLNDCIPKNAFSLYDPDGLGEAELEASVVRALSCVYRDYECIVFTGGFRYDGRVRRPDLALVARDRSHWFVVEVELVSHSLTDHVLPQVTALQYGSPDPDCAGILARELKMEWDRARTMVQYVPRSVAVVANRRLDNWVWALSAHTVQLLTVSRFLAPGGVEALEVDGNLEVVAQSLGFGTYSATDRSLRFPKSAAIPIEKVQINDPRGAPSLWTVSASADSLWITKDVGTPEIPDGSFVQIVRTIDGRLSLRTPGARAHVHGY